MADLNNTWKEFFNKENVYSYAKASIALYEYLKVLDGEYSSIVIPSRGAVPFLRHARSLNHLMLHTIKDRDERWQYKLESLSEISGKNCILPFSADPFDNLNSEAIRGFWVKVLKDLIDRKRDSIYLKFYKFLVEEVAKEGWYHTLGSLPNERFVFIDTVISGQAICEVIKHFEKNNLSDFYLILLVDEEGKKIKPEYKRILDYYKGLDKCELIYVKKLYTEDQGPAVSGIWSTVYPEIMSHLSENYDWAKEVYGAGTFYTKVSSSRGMNGFIEDESDYNLPVTVMYSTLTMHISMVLQNYARNEDLRKNKKVGSTELSEDQIETMIQGNEKSLDQLLEYSFMMDWDRLQDFFDTDENPLDKETTKKLSMPRLSEKYEKFNIDVSCSHLVRVSFDEEQIRHFFKIFEQEYVTLDNVFDGFPPHRLTKV